jgi:uncharacterized repeat protein (TIGR03803 family)
MLQTIAIFRTILLNCALVLAVLGLLGSETAAAFDVKHTFTEGTDGGLPQSGVIVDRAGNFYGTTYWGGNTVNCPYPSPLTCGTIFKVSSKGVETVLYAFCQTQNCPDGYWPSGGLIEDGAGNLYGMTSRGGANNGGTVFKLTPNGTETVIYSFCQTQNCLDGYAPSGGLIMDSAGNFYGTAGGGANGAGTVFKLTPGGMITVLYSFGGGSDGDVPLGSLIADGAGNLYGTTLYGGNPTNCPAGEFYPAGCGTVFKLAPNGTETVLYAFGGGTDGAEPNAGLVADSAGNLYGTTQYGGDPTPCPAPEFDPAGCGTVFSLAPDGTETVLHSFQSGRDGAFPRAGLIADGLGNLYGTTYFSGGIYLENCSAGCGTVFKMAYAGTETVLHRFTTNASVGPSGPLLLHNNLLFGTTLMGGGTGCDGSGCGTVFRLEP